MVIWIVIVSYLIYLAMQEYKRKTIQKMRDGLSVGDCIITAGGLSGVINKVEEDSLIILIDPSNEEVRVEKDFVIKYKSNM